MKKSVLFIRGGCGFFLACAMTLGPVRGQQSIVSATLSGHVEDATGAAVPGATLCACSPDSNQCWRTKTDQQGRFRLLSLPASRYTLKADSPGFSTAQHEFTLQVGQAFDVPVKLQLAGSKESVNVIGDVPVVDLVRTQVSAAVSTGEVDALPLNGRNYLDLALLVPGVSKTNTGSNQRFAETSAVPGTGISMAGQRNLNNGFILDGFSINDDAADLSGAFFSQDVIREFQVITSGGIAEFGRASGGFVSVVSRSGTNDWRGRVYGFLRNQRLDARNPLASRKDPLTQTQYGASVGGPLKRDRTFLFSNFEQTRQNAASFITISPNNVPLINADLAGAGYRGPLIATGEYPISLHTTNLFSRVDHKLNENNSLSARYSFYDVSGKNMRGAGGLNALSRGSSVVDRDHTLAVTELVSLSAKMLNEVRFQFTRSHLTAPVNDLTGPAVNISGIASFGTATFSPTWRSNDLFEMSEGLSIAHGAHTVKAGADYLLNRLDIGFPGALQGVYTFSSIANLQAARYINYQQAFGREGQFQSNPNFGAFVQEEWKPRYNLTINAGLRYDLQWLPGSVGLDRKDIAPRIGVAYSPGDRKTVIRAGFGLYYDRIPLRAMSNALQRDGINYRVAVLSFGQAGAPVFPNTLPSFPSGVLTSITKIDPNIRNSYSHQTDLQIERELTKTTSISVGYLHLRGMHLILSRNVNVPTLSVSGAAQLGIPNLGRPDPSFANISRYEGSGDSYYNGLTVSFNKRASRYAGFRVSYTLAKAIDDTGNFFFSAPQNNFNLRDDRGLSDNDQRHRVSFSGTLDAAFSDRHSVVKRSLAGLQFSYILSYASALPFNIQTGTDRNNDTNVNDRPEGVGRNTGRAFNFASLDLRLSRTFRLSEKNRLETMVEGFNVFNRSNWQFPNNVIGTGVTPLPSFGRPTGAADPRQLQIGMRFHF